MDANPLLDTCLKQIGVPTFVWNHRKVAEKAARSDDGYDRLLLAAAKREVEQRTRNRIARRITGACLPVLKGLADFDFWPTLYEGLAVIVGTSLRFAGWTRSLAAKS